MPVKSPSTMFLWCLQFCQKSCSFQWATVTEETHSCESVMVEHLVLNEAATRLSLAFREHGRRGPEEELVHCELSSGHGTASILLNTEQLWLSARELGLSTFLPGKG